MGAVFTIFLLTPLFLPVMFVNFIIEKFTGISPEEQFETLSGLINNWAAENPETVAEIGDALKGIFHFIMELAEKADSIL